MRKYVRKYGVVRIIRRERGIVIRPTYGIAVKKKIADLVKNEYIAVLFLKKQDFISSCKCFDDLLAPNLLAYADHGNDVIVINATTVARLTQQNIDFVFLHEIEHIRRCTNDEDVVDKCAYRLAKRLGIVVKKPE